MKKVSFFIGVIAILTRVSAQTLPAGFFIQDQQPSLILQSQVNGVLFYIDAFNFVIH
jgi:hypothetical protein